MGYLSASGKEAEEWLQGHMKPIALSTDFCFQQGHLIMSEVPV